MLHRRSEDFSEKNKNLNSLHFFAQDFFYDSDFQIASKKFQ